MRFGFIKSDFGLDTSKAPATMVVAVGGENFILVHDAASVKLETKSSRIKIHEIVDKKELYREIARVRFGGLRQGNSPNRKLVEFLEGIYATFTQDDGKLFRITASSGGFAEVFAVDKATKATLKLNVSMLQKQEYSVDFRFPFALDTSGQKYRLSKMVLANAQAWLEEVNIIFGPQLNIFFKFASASEPFINEQIVSVGSNHWEALKDKRNPDSKTITVFLARSILTRDKTHPLGISLNQKSRVILLQDRDSEDELVKTLAHEFVHTVADMKGVYVGHPGGKGDLMISYSRFDGVRIGSEIVSVIGKQ